MATFIAVTEAEFVDQVFAAAERLGIRVRLNPDGRQLDFAGNMLSGSQPSVISPFFDLVTAAGLAVRSEEDGRLIYRFRLSNRVS